MKNTLALCIPAYNASDFLARLLKSAKNQAIPFDEILVYNDFSTDNTAEIAKIYGAKVICGVTNLGCSSGKNILAAATSCNWIHFHDADDDILPNFTTEIHGWLQQNSDAFDVLLLSFDYVDGITNKSLAVVKYDADDLKADPLRYAIKKRLVNFGVYKRNVFLKAGGFDLDIEVLYNEDSAMHQNLAKHGLRFDCLNEITCINYKNENSMSMANKQKCARANYHVIAKTAATHGQLYAKELSDKLWICIADLGSAQDWEYVKKALQILRLLGHQTSTNGSKLFNALTTISPYGAIWSREKLIRLFKSQLRK